MSSSIFTSRAAAPFSVLSSDSTPSSSDARNEVRLKLLLDRAPPLLRDAFVRRWQWSQQQPWDDNASNGAKLVELARTNIMLQLAPVQRRMISEGISVSWDITLLTRILLDCRAVNKSRLLTPQQRQFVKAENVHISTIRKSRNTIAHHSMSVDKDTFQALWSTLKAALVALGDKAVEIDALRHSSVVSGVEFKHDHAVKDEAHRSMEAQQLKTLANQSHQSGRFLDAIATYTNAIALGDTGNEQLAILFSNRSASYMELHNTLPSASKAAKHYVSLATEDARMSYALFPTWWRASYRVAKALEALEKYDEALQAYEEAARLEPSNAILTASRDKLRNLLAVRSREEHLDPRNTPMTISERADELHRKTGGMTNSNTRRRIQALSEKYDPGLAAVMRGHQFRDGDEGVNQDYSVAAQYYAKAVKLDNAEGIYNLAQLTQHGRGIRQDMPTAVALYQRAAAMNPRHPLSLDIWNTGVAEAEHALGLLYTHGIGVTQDRQQAAEWYLRSSEHGSAEAANNLGTMYVTGDGVEQNVTKARQFLTLAATRGDPNAMMNLADLLLYHALDPLLAMEWNKRAVENGVIKADLRMTDFDRRCTLQANILKSLTGCSTANSSSVSRASLEATLLDPYRVQLVSTHRRYRKEIAEALANGSDRSLMYTTWKPPRKQCAPCDMTMLQPITLKLMDPTKDQVYKQRSLTVTIYDAAASVQPSICLLLQDENNDIQRAFIYGYDPRVAHRLAREVFVIGCKMKICNPYLRLANDDKPAIRVDDPGSIVFYDADQHLKTMCYCCGVDGATQRCSRCMVARYCSKQCQSIDWTTYSHKSVCVSPRDRAATADWTPMQVMQMSHADSR